MGIKIYRYPVGFCPQVIPLYGPLFWNDVDYYLECESTEPIGLVMLECRHATMLEF
jgi:hypothetical protein